MSAKNFAGAPFGTQTARFDVSAVHPKSKVPGTFTEIPYDKRSTDELKRRLGPGVYDVDVGGFNRKSVDERASGPGWARAYELQRMATLPHLLHKDQWDLKKLLQKKLGPGSYEMKDFLEVSDLRPRSFRGICHTLDARFRDTIKTEETPGPGTYGKGGVPHAVLDDKERLSMSTIGMLDAGSSTPRNLPTVGSHLGPGTYKFVSFTEGLARKVTSLRGPYDLYSGDRDKPIITGHLAAPLLQNLGPGQYDLDSFVDHWDSNHQKKHGKFGKVERVPKNASERIFCHTLSQCPREEMTPGPGHYDQNQVSSSMAKNLPGFLSSAQRNDRLSQKFFTRNYNPIGPGRYDIQRWDDSQQRNGNTSVFRSCSQKPGPAMEKFLKERIRSKDVPLKDRVFLVQPEGPASGIQRSKTQSRFQNQKSVTIA